MTKSVQQLNQVITDGQSGRYSLYVRSFSGRVRDLIKFGNPLLSLLMRTEIYSLLVILNPELEEERNWFRTLAHSLEGWCNDVVATNRLLGIKDDNHYDRTIFEQVMEELFLEAGREAPRVDEMVYVSRNNLVDLIEMCHRRFK